jgi:hypothetical protein
MRKTMLTLALALAFAPPTRKPRAEPTTSAALRRILPPSNRRRAGDGDLIAGRDSPVSAAAGAAGAAPVGDRQARGRRNGGLFPISSPVMIPHHLA